MTLGQSSAYKGFSLIELMIVIAIIGILAAVAIPNYQNYIKRSQMTEVIGLLENFKNELIQQYDATGTWPSTVLGFPQGNSAFNSSNGGTANTQIINWMASSTNNHATVTIKVTSNLGSGWPRLVILSPNTTGNSGTSYTIICGFWDTSSASGSNNSLSKPYMASNCTREDLNTLY